MEDKKSDWSMMDLYSRSFEIVKNNKVTWAFGMALALASGTSFNSSNNLSSKDFSGNHDQTSQIIQVLTVITKDIFSEIPISFYFFLGLEILVVLTVAIIISLIFKAWSEGSLTHSNHIADTGKKPLMAESSEKAFYNIRSLIWLSIIPGLIAFLAVMVFGIIWLTFFLSFKSLSIWIVLLLLPIGIIFTIGLILLALSLIWASRITILEGTPAFASLKKGYQIVRKKKWSMILLGFVNMILSGIVIFAPIFAGIVVFFIGLFLYFLNKDLLPYLLGLGALLAIILFGGMFLLSGMIHAWKNAVWTIAYEKLKGKYD